MNAIEHGNQYDPALDVQVECGNGAHPGACERPGAGPDIPDAVTPDIEAKLAGEQTPRGWGLFLIGKWSMRSERRGTATDMSWSSS